MSKVKIQIQKTVTFNLFVFISVHKLMEMHEGSSTAAVTTSADPSDPAGVTVERPDNYEPPVLETV